MFGIKEVDTYGLQKLGGDKPVLLVDVRTESEVARGMIDGAVHIPLHLLPLKMEEMCKETPTVLYCHSGARSAQACAYMASRGFDNVFNLQGGILAWLRAGQALANVA
ncbi:MAG: rhodanese-like domain-containing protein [Sulfuricellaceae bacterium]|jgi:rhodanese-related sulfurtransferase